MLVLLGGKQRAVDAQPVNVNGWTEKVIYKVGPFATKDI